MQQKTERNKLIVKAVKEGNSYSQVAAMFGLKAKSTVFHIWKMAQKHGKYGVRKLSTPTI